jgi:uncharacterized damage-inducible protein DinB
MKDPSLRALLHAYEAPSGRSWHGGATPVGALRNVTAAEAHWVPAPGRHSIWALTLHTAYWKYAVRRHFEPGPVPRFPRSPANWPKPPANPDPKAWDADRALLRLEHERLRQLMAGFAVGRISRIPAGGKKWTYGDLIAGIVAHDAYHTGQIQLLKRLWQSRRRIRD